MPQRDIDALPRVIIVRIGAFNYPIDTRKWLYFRAYTHYHLTQNRRSLEIRRRQHPECHFTYIPRQDLVINHPPVPMLRQLLNATLSRQTRGGRGGHGNSDSDSDTRSDFSGDSGTGTGLGALFDELCIQSGPQRLRRVPHIFAQACALLDFFLFQPVREGLDWTQLRLETMPHRRHLGRRRAPVPGLPKTWDPRDGAFRLIYYMCRGDFRKEGRAKSSALRLVLSILAHSRLEEHVCCALVDVLDWRFMLTRRDVQELQMTGKLPMGRLNLAMDS